MMHDQIEFQILQQRHKDLLREAEAWRLAKASQMDHQVHVRRIPALKWELKRYIGRAIKFVVRSYQSWRKLTGKGTS